MSSFGNFGQAIILMLIGLTTMFASAFLIARAKDQAGELATMGHAIVGAALMMLYQSRGEAQTRVILGGERASDHPPAREGSASGQ